MVSIVVAALVTSVTVAVVLTFEPVSALSVSPSKILYAVTLVFDPAVALPLNLTVVPSISAVKVISELFPEKCSL